jgi:hypothetical protein
MNFDLAEVPTDKFVITKANSTRAREVRTESAVPYRLDEFPDSVELLQFDPFVQEGTYNINENTEIGKSASSTSSHDENTENEPPSVGKRLSSLLQLQQPHETKCTGEESAIDLDWLLSCISPPQELYTDMKRFVRYVSKTPAGTTDAYVLERRLDRLLQDREAERTGVCPIRRSLHDACFDELIRQVALSSSRERSILFLRFRDELKRTRDAYVSLYANTISYCTLKESSRELAQRRKQEKGTEILEDTARLKALLGDLEAELANATSLNNTELEITNHKHREEIDFLRTTNLRLKRQLAFFTTGQRPKDEGAVEGTKSQRTVRAKSFKQVVAEVAGLSI